MVVGSAHLLFVLAIMNPSARRQVEQYMQSVQCLFSLMIEKKHDEFRKRIEQVRSHIPEQCKLLTTLCALGGSICFPRETQSAPLIR